MTQDMNTKFIDKVFHLPVRIYYEDTDAGEIVYYANYLRYAERARTEFLRALGFEQTEDLAKEDRFGFIVRKAELEYLKPSKLDDLLHITCEMEEIKGATIVIKQEIKRGDEVRVKIKVTVAYISLAKMRPIRVPEAMVEKFNEFRKA